MSKCVSRVLSHDCGHSEDVFLNCGDDIKLRLVNETGGTVGVRAGRLEAQVNLGTW